jgi:hypothetical protein
MDIWPKLLMSEFHIFHLGLFLKTNPDVKLIIPSLVDLLEDFVEVLLRLAQRRKVWVLDGPGPAWTLEAVLRFKPMKTYKLAIRKHQF